MADEIWYSASDGHDAKGRFEHFAKLQVAESIEADKHVYRDIIVLRHRVTGSNDVSVTPLKPWNRADLMKRFPEAWAAFAKEMNETPVDGTPLAAVDFLNDQDRLTLMASGYVTLEELAALNDDACNILGFGWRTKRDGAAMYLDANKPKPAAPAVAEPEDKPAKRKRGRPRKAEVTA